MTVRPILAAALLAIPAGAHAACETAESCLRDCLEAGSRGEHGTAVEGCARAYELDPQVVFRLFEARAARTWAEDASGEDDMRDRARRALDACRAYLRGAPPDDSERIAAEAECGGIERMLGDVAPKPAASPPAPSPQPKPAPPARCAVTFRAPKGLAVAVRADPGGPIAGNVVEFDPALSPRVTAVAPGRACTVPDDLAARCGQAVDVVCARAGRPRWPGWSAVAAGVAAGAGAIALGLSGLSRAEPCRDPDNTVCDRDRIDSIDRRLLVANVLVGVSVALTVGGAAWVLYARWQEGQDAAPAAQASVGIVGHL